MWQVWVFLAPLCPICQDYTFYLNALHEQWSVAQEPQVELIGWFPNPTVTDEVIAEFADRSACQRLGPHVPDASAGTDSGEPSIRNYCDFATPRQVLQG